MALTFDAADFRLATRFNADFAAAPRAARPAPSPVLAIDLREGAFGFAAPFADVFFTSAFFTDVFFTGAFLALLPLSATFVLAPVDFFAVFAMETISRLIICTSSDSWCRVHIHWGQPKY
ncbi:MAG: hypothetical protein JO068_12545 [Hyphomicrobiales bacterium]|nr:hypothetical protein [Hyphomicrobiales bacterium]